MREREREEARRETEGWRREVENQRRELDSWKQEEEVLSKALEAGEVAEGGHRLAETRRVVAGVFR